MGDSHCASIRSYARMSRMIICFRLTLSVWYHWSGALPMGVWYDGRCNVWLPDHIRVQFFIFLSTLLVQVAMHRVSFIGHVDSKRMRWTDDQIVGDLLLYVSIIPWYRVKGILDLNFLRCYLFGFWICDWWSMSGGCQICASKNKGTMFFFKDKCIRCRGTAIKADMQAGGIKYPVLAACPMSRIVL